MASLYGLFRGLANFGKACYEGWTAMFRRAFFFVVLAGALGSPAYSFNPTRCLKSLAESAVGLLGRYDLVPFRLGSDLPEIDLIPEGVLPEQFGDVLNENWTPLGTESEKGTIIQNPRLLIGKVVTGFPLDSDRPVTGKVLSVSSPKKGVIELYLITPEGRGILHLPGTRAVHVLEHPGGVCVRNALQWLKTQVENHLESGRIYLNEVCEVVPRALLARRDLDEEASWPFYGFGRKELKDHGAVYWIFHPLHYALYKVDQKPERDYFVVPSIFRGLLHHTFTRPSSKIAEGLVFLYEKARGPIRNEKSRDFLSGPVKLNALWSLLLGSMLFYETYEYGNHLNDQAQVAVRREVIAEHESLWLEKIHKDPFLARVRHKLEDGGFTPGRENEEAAEEAFVWLLALTDYYFYMDEIFDPQDTDTAFHKLVEDPIVGKIFPATRYLRDFGPREEPGIWVPAHKRRPATQEEFRQLMWINHRLYQERPLLSAWTMDLEVLRKMLYHTDFNEEYHLHSILSDLLNDPYKQALLALHSVGKIDDSRLNYLLLEDAQWHEKFSRWELFEAERYIEEGGTRKVLTLHDFRMARLKSLESTENGVEQLARIDLYPHMEFDSRQVLDRYGGDLANIHIVRRTVPYLRNLGTVNRYVRGAARGRYKNAARGQALKVAAVMRETGEVTSSVVRQSPFVQTLGVLGKGVILFDLYVHLDQWGHLRTEVLGTVEMPYLEQEPTEFQPDVEKLLEQLEELRGRYRGLSDKEIEERFRNSGNPYLVEAAERIY